MNYKRCADFYDRAGIDLKSEPLAGIGTVCRRQHKADVQHIMRTFASRNLRLHGFGIKIDSLSQWRRSQVRFDVLEQASPLRARMHSATAPNRTAYASPSWYRRSQTRLNPAGTPTEGLHPNPLARIT